MTIRTAFDTDWGEVAIVDNGSGMPLEIQQRIFDSSFTTKPPGRGTGMGLSISHQIITEKHGGKLECFSTLGKGTKFMMRIPLRQSVPSVQGRFTPSSKISVLMK
ncbi:sensor histidine kinase [Leptolyngbya sp. 7M]|uniref:sensor histidine kinase n=1 Tax=Leptolyngbya sp. 7M TaxID=2812896 RepID=UPI001B8CB7A8|nr:ATP-binding protein [Leptolyngbya sp. 7M]QYO68459.1 hypothetical protein JVX88_11690 [Leptolyngbya sp. 7M]